ncbi:restriction endonuclease subunit S [Enterococcus faecalis]|uniref:restriction endonuclease subunit S n=1 Tax=Enterococcus faecalis TaxID=1351 RepID=UPI001E53CD23|nr:restriction endonuclease subunit S [Enterococcus faecalis]MCD5070045.1 restriction endonuclease subunit S [Enterococcus faecalis]
MAKIDDSVKKKVPELRFKGFTDDWEERKLGEFSDVRDGTHASPKYVSQGHPMVTSKNLTHSGLDMTDVSFLTDKDFNEINKRSKVSIGDILFGMIGTIGNPVIVDRDDFAIKNVALIKEKTSNPITNKWLLQYLKSPSFNRFIQKENAGGTQKFIALGLIRDMKLRVPEFDEQQKIGAFFKQIDDTIALHQRKLDLLKEQKKGYLQKMFPKNGAKVPELRFAGFADDWEERKLGDVGDTFTGLTGKTKEDFGHGSAKFVTYVNVFQNPIATLDQLDAVEIDEKQNQVQKGDVFFTTSSETPEEVGMSSVWTYDTKNVYLNSFTFGYRPRVSFDLNYMASMLRSPSIRKKITFLAQGISRYNISKTKMLEIEIPAPNLSEQKKIGSFFKLLDDTIALHQRKLDLLKEQKKGFLQKMFI